MELNPCPSELLITGSPKHDELRQKYAALSQSKRPLVVFYSTRSGSWVIGVRDFERHLAAVYAAAKALPDVEFVVKLHPGETRATVERLSTDSSRPPNVRVTQADDAYELLQRCHAAMTVSSTVGYEALLFRRPLLILNLTGQECQLPMPRECMADYVTQAEDLASAVRRVLASPTSSVAAADDFWLNDGNALERILTSADCRSRRTTMERQP
jgi:UDP-N-acetylglucosamine 2-epimerase